MIGAASKFFTVDWPETAKFLTDDERRILVAKLAQANGVARMDHLDKRAVKRVFSDWKIYCAILMYFGIVNTGYAGSVSCLSSYLFFLSGAQRCFLTTSFSFF